MTFLARVLDRAFGHPAGLLGRLGGLVMARGNAATELQVVQLAQVHSSYEVAVIGHGPGVGLRAAGLRAARAVGVEPSAQMRRAASRRCEDLIRSGKVEIRAGTAEETGLPDRSFDSVLAVNNAQIWPNRVSALAELHRILRPGGMIVLSTHERWLPGGREGLSADAKEAGFVDIQSWLWGPPGRLASTAAQLRAYRRQE